jgi:hypothetical protein
MRGRLASIDNAGGVGGSGVIRFIPHASLLIRTANATAGPVPAERCLTTTSHGSPRLFRRVAPSAAPAQRAGAAEGATRRGEAEGPQVVAKHRSTAAGAVGAFTI